LSFQVYARKIKFLLERSEVFIKQPLKKTSSCRRCYPHNIFAVLTHQPTAAISPTYFKRGLIIDRPEWLPLY